MVAGGLGERLGYNGLKVALPTETVSGKSYLAHYIETILNYQERAREATGNPSLELPLAIMTSADTDAGTRELLRANNNFGMTEGQVTLLKQGKVPAILDNDGHIALEDGGFRIQTKPHGHGDVHSILHLSGTVTKWIEAGFTHMFIFQDTNFFAPRSGLLALGVCTTHDFDMCSTCVPRIAGEAIGGICTLRGEGKPTMTINVEYNQIDAMLRATEQYKAGDVNDPSTGFSIWPGNINELVFKLSSYNATLQKSKGQVPEFVNPKYADAAKTVFKAPTRLECMMQDFPRLYTDFGMQDEVNLGFASLNFPAVRLYSPVKNDAKDASIKQKNGLDPACAFSGEMDVYRFYADYLRAGGMEIGEDLPEVEYLGVRGSIPPAVSLSARFLSGQGQNVSGGRLASGSVLVIKGGGDVILRNVKIDGAMIVETVAGATVTFENIEIKNAGWRFEALSEAEQTSEDTPEEIAIRGYKVVKEDAEIFEHNEPGAYRHENLTPRRQ